MPLKEDLWVIVEVSVYAFWTSLLDLGGWSNLRPSYFGPVSTLNMTHCTGGEVDVGTGPDAMAK